MLPVKKIYIDSKNRTADSASSTNFKIDLVESLTMPEDCVFQVADVIVPHTWYLISNARDHNLYLREYRDLVVENNSVTRNHVLEIPEGNYTGESLASAIQQAFKKIEGDPQDSSKTIYKYTVNWDPVQESIQIIPDASANVIQSNGNYNGFEILTDATRGYPNQITQLNDLLGNFGASVKHARTDLGQPGLEVTPIVDNWYISKRIDFLRIKFVYIKSPNLGTFKTLGSFGERTIIKKVPVTAPQGELIIDDTRSGFDILDCSRQTLRKLEFQLTDERGNTLDLHTHDVSFSLIFSLHTKE